jgi:hypothetical protein
MSRKLEHHGEWYSGEREKEKEEEKIRSTHHGNEF